MSRAMDALRKASPIIVVMLLGATLFVAYSVGNIAFATHEPANKTAITADDIDQLTDATPILSDTMRVSTRTDLILNASTECSIITRLSNGAGPTAAEFSSSADTHGAIRLWITLDGNRVPVSANDATSELLEDLNDGTQEGPNDVGEVTFCNREFFMGSTDDEQDGLDFVNEFLHTRTANAFTWLALDVGTDQYDTLPPNNIVEVKLWADYDRRSLSSGTGGSFTDAFVGSRTLIIEPTHASVHEQAEPQGGAGS